MGDEFKPYYSLAPQVSGGILGLQAPAPSTGISLTNAGSIAPKVSGGILDQFEALPWFGGSDGKGGKTLGKLDYGLAAGQSLLGAFMGMKNYGLAKKQLAFQQDSWNKEYEAQRSLINSQLEDRQRRRVAENPGLAQDTASYMAKYGVK